MRRLDLVLRVRSYTRDFSNSIFREQDIIDYINESIERFQQIIPQLKGLTPLVVTTDSPDLIPSQHHHLLALFSASRCFAQDQSFYQATTLMNEFEVKLQEFQGKVESGQIVIVDPVTGLPVATDNVIDYVDMKPYWEEGVVTDLDLGVLTLPS